MVWFVSEEEDFVTDVALDCEPVKVDEGGHNVLPGFTVCVIVNALNAL